jgi:putative CocE/NonD family hydrolase
VPQITAKAHLIAGWYDIFLRGQLEDYAALKRAGRSPHLTIGPWHHTSPDLAFDSVREALKWFDANLQGNGQRLGQQPVRVFVLGAKEWREFADWPPLSQEIRYSLYSRGQLVSQPPAADSSPDYYRYDPSDPTPSIGGSLLDPKSAGQQDNRALEARRDVLCYTTPELDADVEIIGPPRLQLYAQSSAAHSDFFARLCDVYPDGSSLNVCDGLVRTKSESDRPQSAASRCIEIEMHSIGYRFLRRHRIRLQVSSGAHPRWSRNLGMDEPFATSTRMITVDQTIYHDITHPSALILPVM